MRFALSRRSYSVSLLAACTAGVIVVISLLARRGTANLPSDHNDTVSARANAISTITATTADLLDIPLYAGAQNVQGDRLNDSVDRHMHTEFRTKATREDVLAFYEKALVAKGWLPDDRQLSYKSPEDIRAFRWFDRSNSSPYALAMSVYLAKTDDAGRLFYVDRDKWPDIYHVPLYPDASDVQTIDSPLDMYAVATELGIPPQPARFYSFWRVITTTYTTRADLGKLVEYYTPIMTEIGCEPLQMHGSTASPEPAGNRSESPDLGYYCAVLTAPQRRLAFTLALKVTVRERNMANVEVVANGYDVGDRNR